MFPAVIFPGGGGTILVDGGRASFQTVTLVGFDNGGSEIALDVNEILDPIPASYVSAIAAESFGQAVPSNVTLRIRILDKLITLPRSVPSPSEAKQARRWLARKLLAAGLRADSIEVRTEEIQVDYDSGDVISRRILDARSISLD